MTNRHSLTIMKIRGKTGTKKNTEGGTHMSRTTRCAYDGQIRGWLIQKRKELGLSQGKVAEAAGISQPSYCDIENGVTRTPKPETAKKIAAIVGEPWTRFYEEDENE